MDSEAKSSDYRTIELKKRELYCIYAIARS